MSLEALRSAVERLVVGLPNIQLSLTSGEPAFLVVTAEFVGNEVRTIRIGNPDVGNERRTFGLRWECYRSGPGGRMEGEGGTYGGFHFTLDAVRHWIVDRQAWSDVPEF